MKKLLSLFLALIMALGLCTTAFAGNTAGTTALYLTGSAADQVVNLKSGQLVDSSSDVAVRLNVQEDPGETEYTVTLDGQEIEADHSTAQYHFYYLPASRLVASAATLSIDDGTSSNEPAITVTINGVTRTVALPADGSTDFAKPTALTAEYTYAESSGALDRIYLGISDETAVNIGTSLSSKTGVLSGTFAKLTAGYTTSTFYFYKTPKKLTKTVYVVYTDAENAAHYYKITISRAPQEGYVLAPGSSSTEDAPGGANTYSAATGEYITAMVKGYAEATFTYHDLTLFNNGASSSTTVSPAFSTDSSQLCYLKDGTTAYFARPGRYWVSASVEKDDITYTGAAPFLATWTLAALNAHLTEADTLKSSEDYQALPVEARQQFEAVVDRLSANTGSLNSTVYLTESGTIAGADDTPTAVQARDFGGKQLVGERLLEGDECALLDLMAIFQTWSSDTALGQYQYEAYNRILTLGLSSYVDVTTAAQQESYSAYKQAKWDLIHTTDLEGINAILTDLELETIAAEPQVTPGDINGDGEIDILDAGALVQHINGITQLDGEKLEAADINGDGTVDILDAGILVQYINGIISALN